MSVRVPYAYTNGTVFSPADHSTNIYDNNTVGGAENGILSATNGGQQAADFDVAFEIAAEHVQPGEAIIADGSSVMDANNFYDDVFGDFESASFLKIPGRTLRIDLPWDADVLWHLQCFISFDIFVQDNNGSGASPDVLLRLELDGSQVTASNRGLSVSTAFDDSDGDGTYASFFGLSGAGAKALERRKAHRFSLSWLSQGLSEGIHELGLVLYIQKLTTVNLNIGVSFGQTGAVGAASINTPCELHSRVSFGISHVTALPLFMG